MNEQKKYYYRLDLIRIVSCIMVFLYHLNIIKGGFLAVCTFFTLSGYLSCISALRNNKFSLKKYYLNRFIKIYLPLLVVVSITLIIFKQFNSLTWLNLKPETISVIFGYNNFWQLGAKLDYFVRHVHSPFMHLWYISILLQFDLIFPIIFVILKKIDKKIYKNSSLIFVSLLTIIMTSLFYYMSKNQDIMVVYYNSFARSFSLLFGVLFALIQYKFNLQIPGLLKKLHKVIFNFYFLIFIIICTIIPDNSKNYALYMIFITALSVKLIQYGTVKTLQNDSLNGLIKFLSKATYEIYLVQYPVIFFVESLLMKNNYKLFIISILTIIISYILHFLVNLSTKNILSKIFKIIVLSIIIIFSGYILYHEKDHTKEMKELENKLSDNLKLIEEKNNNYVNALKEEQDEWNKILEDMKVGEEQVAESVKKMPVVGIGDSVLLGASGALYKTFPNGYFDGKVSRSIIGAEDLLISLKNDGKLGNTLILALANNGDYSNRVNTGLMNILGDREIYWVSAVKADDPSFNTKFKEFAKGYPNIHIVEWEELSKNHPEYFYADGIHLKEKGQAAYANAIYDAIYNNYLNKFKKEQNELIKKHEEEKKNKITFYGNDALTNSYSYIQEKFEKASFNAKESYNFTNLYNELKEKINNKTLEYKIVLLFDQKANLSNEQYNKIIDLCKDYKIYICNITNNKISFENENIKVINFYDEIKNNEDYVSADKIHLTKKGNQKLASVLINNID